MSDNENSQDQTVANTTDPLNANSGDEGQEGARNDGGDTQGLNADQELSADDYLSQLLSDHDSQSSGTTTQATSPQSTPGQPSVGAGDDLSVRLSALEQRLFDADFKEVVNGVRGDLPQTIYTDDFVEAWVEARAKKNPELLDDWDNRYTNPRKWAKAVSALGETLQKHFAKMPDPNVTEDVNAVAQAVRGTTGKAPDRGSPKYDRMSDNEFADEVEKEHGFRPM